MISMTLSGVPAAQRKLAEDVLHHHHGAVDQNAEIHRADGEQVCRRVLEIQADEREQQREWNGRRDDQTGTKIVEKEYEDDDDEQYAPQQILLHDIRRQLDQIGPVVKRHDLDVLGQDLFVEFLRLRLDAFQNVLRFFAGAQEDHAFHRVVLLLVAELAQAAGQCR